MGERPTRLSGLIAVFLAALLVVLPAAGQDSNRAKIADGLAVYLGVLPAAMIQGHPAGHTEAEMHDEASSGRDAYHVMVAVFDAKSGARIADADVRARVAGVGLVGKEKALEPMTIADTITYGNYFAMPPGDLYRIRVVIRRPGGPTPVEALFSYDLQTQ